MVIVNENGRFLLRVARAGNHGSSMHHAGAQHLRESRHTTTMISCARVSKRESVIDESRLVLKRGNIFCLFNRVECFACDEYTRHVQSIVPGAVAVLALVSVMVFFESIFVCKRRGKGKPEREEGHLYDRIIPSSLSPDYQNLAKSFYL